LILSSKVSLFLKSDENAAKKNYDEIKKFIVGTRAENSPIIPISA
jgi:translation initiation factor 2 gamma subunit (eIF-2gamma)